MKRETVAEQALEHAQAACEAIQAALAVDPGTAALWEAKGLWAQADGHLRLAAQLWAVCEPGRIVNEIEWWNGKPRRLWPFGRPRGDEESLER